MAGHITFEGYGPGGAAVLVACVTDDRDRTAAAVRGVFAQCGGNLGAIGSVSYLFNEVGVLNFPHGAGVDAITEVAHAAGAEDVIANSDGSIDVLTDPREFARVKAALEDSGLTAETGKVTFRSSVNATLGEKDAVAMLRLLQALEELRDVQNVYSNAAIPAHIRARP